MASDSISVGPQDADHRRLPQDVRPVHHDPARHDRRGAGHRDRRPQGRRDRPRGVLGGRGDLQRLAALPDARPAAQRPAGAGDHRPAGGVHGRHGGQHLGLQHGVQLRPLAGPTSSRTATDDYYLAVGRIATVAATVDRHLHRRPGDELLQHHGLPADAVRVLQRPAVRDVHPRHVLEADDARPPAGWGWSAGTLSAVVVAFLSEDAFGSPQHRGHPGRRPGRRVPGGVDRVRRRHRAEHRGLAGDHSRSPSRSWRAGLLRDAARGAASTSTRRPTPGTAARSRWPASRWPWSSS